MTEFELRVYQWLVEREAMDPAGTITSVVPLGTDWAGDTMSGFHDDFAVTIHYTTSDGKGYADISGSDLESLWKACVR